MSLDDLSCTPTTLHTDHVSQLFSGGIPVTYTKVYPIYKYMQTYTLSCPFDSLSVQTVAAKERPWRSHSVSSFPQPGSGSPGAGHTAPAALAAREKPPQAAVQPIYAWPKRVLSLIKYPMLLQTISASSRDFLKNVYVCGSRGVGECTRI